MARYRLPLLLWLMGCFAWGAWLPRASQAATYYVSPAGNNSSAGTSAGTAWQTIQRAANTATAGDTIFILAGTYAERVTFPNSGTAGNPITFVGARGGGGSWDTIIDGATPVTSAWTAVGNGSYQASLGFNPGVLTSNGLDIWRIGDFAMANGSGQTALGRGATEQVSASIGTVFFWDGIEALFGYQNGTTYLRFRNGQNPNTMNVRAGAFNGTLTINGKNYITLRDLKVIGGEKGIDIKGGGTNNTVDQCYIAHGPWRVHVTGGTGLTISNSTITSDGFGMQTIPPGDWSPVSYNRIVNRHRYNTNKFIIGNTQTHDSSILLISSATNTTINDNILKNAMAGITFYEETFGTVMSGNTIFQHADNCVYIDSDTSFATFHHNLVYDCDHGMRFNSTHRQMVWDVYANTFWQPQGAGKAIFIAPPGSPPAGSNIRIYQNSMAGWGYSVDVGSDGATIQLPFVHLYNNFVSNDGLTSWGAVNWGHNSNTYTDGVWYQQPLPTFVLPGGHGARNSAPSLISLGLPGMTSGYYVDGSPDHGAIQGTGGGGDITPPTVSITAPAPSATVSGTTVSVTANASDGGGVVGVQFKLDGANLGAEDTTSAYGITWNSTLTTDGTHTLTAVARDAAGNTTTASSISVTVSNGGVGDTTPPTVTMTAPAPSATVSGPAVSVAATASDNVSVIGVQFKLDGVNLGDEQCCSSNDILWNSTLTANGTHVLTAVARDAAGNTTTSGSVSVTVSNGTDTTPPVVALTVPVNAATVSGATVSVTATASDNVAVIGVQFKLDGANLGAEDTTSTYSILWDSTTASNGTHALTAVARDAAGNTTTAIEISVTVSNSASGDTTPPVVAVTAPLEGATISGPSVQVSAIASDNIAIVGVQFKLDGGALGIEQCCASTNILWDTTLVANGTHALTAVARDAAGNTTTSATVTVTVSNIADITPPTVSITAPANAATVSGAAVSVTANANDGVGIVGVQFKLDGANLGAEDTTSTYGVTWNSTLTTDGTHALTAVARDAAGNTTTSATVTVTVSNGGGLVFLPNPSGLSVTGSTTPTFLPNPTGLSVTAP